MVADSTENKAKLIIKTFLAAQPGKKFTSKQIAEFINNNNLGLCKYSVTNYAVTRWIKSAGPRSLLGEINMERTSRKNVWEFWL